MMWYIRALSSALIQSVEFTYSKHLLNKRDPLVFWWMITFSELFCMLLTTFILWYWSRELTRLFFLCVVSVAITNWITRYTVPVALQKSDVWIVVPMMSFIPLFTALLAGPILGEYPTLYGRVGIFLIFVGSFWLQYNPKNTVRLFLSAPFKDTGSQIMIWNAFLWAIANVFAKIWITESNPYIYATWTSFFMLVFLSVAVLIRKRKWETSLSFDFSVVVVGVLKSWSRLMLFLSYATLMVSYALSLKRLSAVFVVILWYVFFKEENIRWKLWWTMCMMLWVLLISFW